MKLSTKGRYAVMAMVHLSKCDEKSPTALSDIAESQGISLSYLEQLFAKLRKEGFVRSVRGPGGGYLLAKDKSEISISDIISAVEEPLTARGCDNKSDEEGCTGTGRCSTHKLWVALTQEIHDWLSDISLLDIQQNRYKNSHLGSCNHRNQAIISEIAEA